MRIINIIHYLRNLNSKTGKQNSSMLNKAITLFILFSGIIFCNAQGIVVPGGGTYSGTTIGAGNDCNLIATNDYYYSFTPDPGVCPDISYTFSLCNTSSSWDSRIYILSSNDCNTATVIASNDDACGVLSQVTTSALVAGTTYYVYIEGFSSGNEGDYTLDVTFSDALSSGGHVLLGDAQVGTETGCYTLTENTSAQTSCIWAESTLDFSTPFSYEFTINLGANDGGADGMAYVIHNDPLGTCACGVGGESLAYGGGTAIDNSLAFEIDTYINTEDRDDFTFPCSAGTCSDPDHVAFHIDGDWTTPTVGAIPLMDGATEYDIENGLDHLIQINWDGTMVTTSILSLDGMTTYASLSYAFDPLVLFGTNTPFVGFTGSTGGLTNLQTVCFPELECTSQRDFARE